MLLLALQPLLAGTSQMENDIGSLYEIVGDLQRNVGPPEERSIRDVLATMQATLADHGSRFDKLDSHLVMQDTRLNHLQLDVLNGFNRIDATLTEHGARLGRIEPTLAEHGGRLDRIDARLEEHSGRLDRIDAKLEEHSGRLDRIDAKLEEHGGRLDRIDARLEEHSVTLAEHGARLDRIDAKLEEHGARLDRIEIKLDEHGGKLDMILDLLRDRGTPAGVG
jgi:chromosome segregation ATPase